MTRRRSSIRLVLASLVVSAAACGQAATATPGPGSTAPAATATSVALPSTPAAATAATPASTLTPAGPLKLLWEAAGDTGATGADPATYSPAVNPLTGDIWVAVSFGGTIWKFSKDGTYKGSFGTPGTADGAFNFVRSTCTPCGAGAIAFAPDGTLFVADDGNNRIEKFDPKGRFVKAWGTFGPGNGQFADANQIATNGREVFVGDDARADTQVFDLDGNYLRTIPTGGWLAVDTAGDLHVSSGGTVLTYHPDGTAVGDALLLPPYMGAEHIGLALDRHNRLFFDYQQEAVPHAALGLGSVDLTRGTPTLWANAGETIAIHDDVIYEANFVTTDWPKAVLRAYELPAP